MVWPSFPKWQEVAPLTNREGRRQEVSEYKEGKFCWSSGPVFTFSPFILQNVVHLLTCCDYEPRPLILLILSPGSHKFRYNRANSRSLLKFACDSSGFNWPSTTPKPELFERGRAKKPINNKYGNIKWLPVLHSCADSCSSVGAAPTKFLRGSRLEAIVVCKRNATLVPRGVRGIIKPTMDTVHKYAVVIY